MKSKTSSFITIVDPAIISKLREFYPDSDMSFVDGQLMTCSALDEAYEGMTASEILHSEEWLEWTPERRWAMCKLVDLMVTHSVVRYVKVGQNECGENRYRLFDAIV